MTKNTYTVAVWLYGVDSEQSPITAVMEQEAETLIRDFEAGRTLTFAIDEDDMTGTGYIPYHAIGHLSVMKTSEEVTVADEFCGETSSDEGGSDEGGSDEGGSDANAV